MNDIRKKIVKNISVILIIITILLGSVYNLMNWTVTEFRANLSERKNAINNSRNC